MFTPHISDRDAMAEAWVSYTHGSVTTALDTRAHSRTGSMETAHGESSDRTTMLTVSYQR